MWRIGEWLLRAGAIFGAVSIWIIAVVVCYDVLMRFAGRPTIWALEVATYLMIGTAILASGKTVFDGKHFAVDLFTAKLPGRLHRVLRLLSGIACVSLMAFVTYGFVRIVALSLDLDMRSATLLRIPLVWPQSILVAGAALMTIAFVLRTFKSFKT